MTIIWTADEWTRESVAADSERNYAFGDNIEGTGNAGQACIRGLPNAFGIPTKVYPAHDEDSFFSDRREMHKGAITDALERLPRNKPLVVNVNIGRGLARLHTEAPKLYGYLLYWLLYESAVEL